MRNIVILGGGYGGLTTINHLLENELPKDTKLILVDRMPYQGLKTEYYALATGTIADADIRVHFPNDPRLQIVFGEVTDIDVENRTIHIRNDESISYDLLCISLGCTDRYHGIPGADLFTHSIQSFSSARLTNHMLSDLKPYSQVSIVGGGLSGVELASELRESRPDLNIRILDRGTSILSAFPEKLQTYVRDWFTEHNIEQVSRVSITRVEPNTLYNHGDPVPTDITVWTAGIQPVEVVQKLDLPKDEHGRLIVNQYYKIPSHPEVFVIGDCASMPFSPSAQLAEVMGKELAGMFQAMLWGQPIPSPGKIKLKGVLGSLGKKSGFGLMGNKTVMLGRVPRVLKSGVLWMSKHHFG